VNNNTFIVMDCEPVATAEEVGFSVKEVGRFLEGRRVEPGDRIPIEITCPKCGSKTVVGLSKTALRAREHTRFVCDGCLRRARADAFLKYESDLVFRELVENRAKELAGAELGEIIGRYIAKGMWEILRYVENERETAKIQNTSRDANGY